MNPTARTRRGYRRGPYFGRSWRRPARPSPLRDARIGQGLTQAEMASRLGINRSQLAGYESGARPLPSPWTEPGRKLRALLAGG